MDRAETVKKIEGILHGKTLEGATVLIDNGEIYRYGKTISLDDLLKLDRRCKFMCFHINEECEKTKQLMERFNEARFIEVPDKETANTLLKLRGEETLK